MAALADQPERPGLGVDVGKVQPGNLDPAAALLEHEQDDQVETRPASAGWPVWQLKIGV